MGFLNASVLPRKPSFGALFHKTRSFERKWEPARTPRTPQNIKVYLESHKKVTFGVSPKVTQKRAQKRLFDPTSDSKVTQSDFSGSTSYFWGPLWNHFGGDDSHILVAFELLGGGSGLGGGGGSWLFPRIANQAL